MKSLLFFVVLNQINILECTKISGVHGAVPEKVPLQELEADDIHIIAIPPQPAQFMSTGSTTTATSTSTTTATSTATSTSTTTATSTSTTTATSTSTTVATSTSATAPTVTTVPTPRSPTGKPKAEIVSKVVPQVNRSIYPVFSQVTTFIPRWFPRRTSVDEYRFDQYRLPVAAIVMLWIVYKHIQLNGKKK